MINRVLITGSTGLLGRRLCEHLHRMGVEVTGIAHKQPNNPSPGIEYIPVDFSNEWTQDQLPSQVDAIIHLAQSSKFRDFPDNALDVFKVNIESTAYLLDYAKKIGAKKFIYASSGGIYGNGERAFNENAPIIPPGKLGYYLGSKACGEILVQSYASVFQVVVLRPFFMYGIGQNRSMLIPRLMDSVATGKPINLQGDNGIRINPVHVEDASAAVINALNLNESATFNIAGPEVLSIREICVGMGRFLGKEPVFVQVEGQPSDLIADISAMNAKLAKPERRLFENLGDVAVSDDS